MNETVVHVENVSKRYRLGQKVSLDRTLCETLSSNFRRFTRRNVQISQTHERPDQYLWALKDVSFSVNRGEVIGIVGRNGAGKSTLLKLLSQITDPTHGSITLRGRYASLLEVGTGFHPELTGRENIYLNGAILGMTRREIHDKFDQIVDFSGVEKFLETPVKRYSSGMRVRLAFAVAAHLEPEILMVDEVLAVGDASFQRRCLGKMNDVAKSGRTVLLVSHNMSVIRTLCPRTLWIDDGQLRRSGDSRDVIGQYLEQQNQSASDSGIAQWQPHEAPGDSVLRLNTIIVTRDGINPTGNIKPQDSWETHIHYTLHQPVDQCRVVLQLRTLHGEIAFTSTDQSIRQKQHHLPGNYTSIVRIPGNLLNHGEYVLRIWIGIPNNRQLVDLHDAIKLSVTGIISSGSLAGEQTNWPGIICPKLEWSIDIDTLRQAA